MELADEMNAIERALSVLRLPAAPGEYDMHAMVKGALSAAGIDARHEVRLCPGCRIDFLCGRVGIEVKKGKPVRRALLVQIERYAACPEVEGIVIVAPGDARLPRAVKGVPVRCVALGRLWGVALP